MPSDSISDIEITRIAPGHYHADGYCIYHDYHWEVYDPDQGCVLDSDDPFICAYKRTLKNALEYILLDSTTT